MKADVFAFGLILYEMVAGKPAFQKGLGKAVIAGLLLLDNFRPEIPEWVDSAVARLITDCWAGDPDDRPGFWEILERLEEMDFKVVPHVNSAKIARFVEKVKKREEEAAAPP
jgi:serine/threonine protein kinase